MFSGDNYGLTPMARRVEGSVLELTEFTPIIEALVRRYNTGFPERLAVKLLSEVTRRRVSCREWVVVFSSE